MPDPIPFDPKKPTLASVTSDKPLNLDSAAAIASHGGNGDDGMNTTQKDYVDARVEAVASNLRADIQGVKLWIVGVGAVSFVSIVGVLLGLLSFGGDRFDGGLAASELAIQSKENARQIGQLIETNSERDEANRKRDQKMDAMLQILQEIVDQ